MPHYYDFDTQINEKGELIFELNNKVINYNSLSKFIKEEYKKISEELQQIFKEKEEVDIELNKLKEEELEKSKEYLLKEKQVSTFLQCRKSVFGKIKYFFKGKGGKLLKSKNKKSKVEEILEENEIQKSISNAIIEEKELYTLDDLIKMCIELDRIKLKVQTAKTVVILLGAPNSGKGTFARKIADKHSIPQISTGDILRNEVKISSKLGLEAKKYMDQGLLVPDELTVKILLDRVAKEDCANGYVLDGFPRTINQAKELDNVLKKDKNIAVKIINLDVEKDSLVEQAEISYYYGG